MTGPGRVDLSWGPASNEGSGVEADQIIGNGAALASVEAPTTTFADTTVAAETQYDYQVLAVDGAGNQSPPSNGVTVTTPVVTEFQLGFRPVADATVKQQLAKKNFGSARTLDVDADPLVASYLRFDVSGTGGRPVVSATLRLRATNSSDAGGTLHRVTNTTWSESSINWKKQPAADAGAVGQLGPVAAGQTYEADVNRLRDRRRERQPAPRRCLRLQFRRGFYASGADRDRGRLSAALTRRIAVPEHRLRRNPYPS
ncbi:MAG TPA: DNRLRE domain-containing protein [Acidimicrobiales bacterium]|nr:DNRLRE domain-containing protein [Acidimicrobiales bacterium]